MRGARWPGDWKYDCQRCGFTFPSSKIKKEWTGLYVCSQCWEPRHPQTLLKIRPETAVPLYINKDSIEQFIQVCDIVTSSGYAGMGTAGCMQAGNNQFTYQFLLEFYSNGHGDVPAPVVARGPRVSSFTPSGDIVAVNGQTISGLSFSGSGKKITIPFGVSNVTIEDCDITSTDDDAVWNQGSNVIVRHCRIHDAFSGMKNVTLSGNTLIYKNIFDNCNLGGEFTGHSVTTLLTSGPIVIDDNLFIGTNFPSDVVSTFESSNVAIIRNYFDVDIALPTGAAFTIGDGTGSNRGFNNYVGYNTVYQTGGVASGVFGSEGNFIVEFNYISNGLQAYDYNSGPFVGVVIRKNVFPFTSGSGYLPFAPAPIGVTPNVDLYGGSIAWATNIDSTDASLVPTS